jgi:tetratricopeptide (TPR) repeat protein
MLMGRRLACACLAGLWTGHVVFAQRPAGSPSAHLAAALADDLALAAGCLDRGDESAAAGHLARHLVDHPDRSPARFSLAELLWRRERFREAGTEYDRFVRDTPPRPATTDRLIQAHTRLLAVAEQQGDAYGEHLHRGIGLYLVAGQDGVEAEPLLCKAAGELTLASRERPAEARPQWYLYLTWQRLAQSQPAARHLRRAAELAGTADLAPHERHDLSAAAATQISGR